jgi:predicted cytidylate kinase
MTYQEALDFLKRKDPLRITVSGDIGAGKSTFAKHLATEIGVPRIYIGQLMREEAAKRNLTLDEFNAQLEQDDEIDRYMDSLQTDKSKEVDRGVFEGRVSWYFVENPDAKLFFTVNQNLAAERIFADKNDLRDQYASVEELATANKQRKQSEETRYKNYYGISAYNPENFDLIIDTTKMNIQEVFEHTVIRLAEFLKKA